jgi:hypothetical protein
MRTRRHHAVVLAFAAVIALAVVGTATAVANNTSTLSGSNVTPSKLPKTTFKSVTLFVHTGTVYTHPGNKAQGGFPKTVTLLFDNDGKINTAGIPKCPGNFTSSTTLKQAWAACGPAAGASKNAYLSPVSGVSGRASTVPPANLPGCVLAFNGPLSGGSPTVVLFTRVFPTSPANCANPGSNTGGFTSVTIKGTVTNAGVPDFGKKLTVPHLDGLALSLDDFTTSVHRGNYLTARCFDANHIFNLRGTFQYSGSGEPTDIVNHTQHCTVG